LCWRFVAQLNSIASELSLLDRYLLARIARFALGAWALLALTYLLFFVGDVGARRAGVVGWRLVMNALPFHLPAILAQLAPAALLCGGALAIEGLQRSNELSAMHSCGYSRVALGKPLLLMGIVCDGSRVQAGTAALGTAALGTAALGTLGQGPRGTCMIRWG
jgi:hypothetical protein